MVVGDQRESSFVLRKALKILNVTSKTTIDRPKLRIPDIIIFSDLAVKDAVENILPQELQSLDPCTHLGVTTRMRWLSYEQKAAFETGNTTILLPRTISSEVLFITTVVSFWKCIPFQLEELKESLCMVLACPPPDQKCSLQGPNQKSHRLLLTIHRSIALIFTGSLLLDARSKAINWVRFSE